MNSAFAAIEKYKMFAPGDSVLVCVSGGADSMALLHFIWHNRDRFSLRSVRAFHLNHGLRGAESDGDENFVRSYCRKEGIPLCVEQARMSERQKPQGKTLEQWARELRYAAFARAAGDDLVLTAHTANDAAETILFNLFRGSGLGGAAGIPPVRGRIVRPLISTTRAEVERYCRENGLEYVTDSSNADDSFSRNDIRHNIIPAAQRINSAAVHNLCSFADISRTARDYIDEQAQELIAGAATGDGWQAQMLCQAHPALKAAALLAITGGAADAKTLVLCEKVAAGSLNAVQLASGVYFVRDGALVKLRKSEKCSLAAAPFEQPLCAGRNLLPGGQIVSAEYIHFDKKSTFNKLLLNNCADCDKISGKIVFRSRRSGDVFKSARRVVSKPLKKLFCELKIPPKNRDRVPLAADTQGVIWLAGQGVAQRVAADERTKDAVLFNFAGEINMSGNMHDDIARVLITEEQIKARIKEIGEQVSADYADKNLICISILKGAVVFVADFIRALSIHTEIDFMGVSSFKGGVVSSGAVKIVKDLDISLEGRDLLIVEDILDSGKTLEYITEILLSRHPASLKICTLLDKPSRRQSSIVADYSGFEIPDEFVVGYGLDYAEKYRNLPYIGVLKPSVYSQKDAEILGV